MFSFEKGIIESYMKRIGLRKLKIIIELFSFEEISIGLFKYENNNIELCSCDKNSIELFS